ncbi:bifunctional demethylmenaquinone methyltransferase/2-methoxy-6-polyprenyl-1,4-benzoquinol methylase UbiE [Flavihumibacter rivuli]|uniref:bifunctional demethylmenaquinone methyltransferase/2-methoxy-6-polyprenyl-1,4-benzoquinol methylase UbiE n=1 Tax=Flavihumibacter rivuli TaxID=2838156 RepID=UPI001BDF381E|nr:bifunctional demethylmenaquinone methyltransferase/2-methoxy-6-polyprenyl-1,4-benzoquinol methylase UbiE [Flavihumibacter rivuli]ULQ56498.1 bifunctional demethylmenaquinone methyltransferase/2-methoxy-6-polyprenyl-1,4-benzoquinol methylase UbiE [Flavihumibacter rivuli]
MSDTLPHDSVVPFKDSDQSKKQQVAEMFDQIAFRYDFLNRFLSGGIDVYWRKRAIAELRQLKPQKVLDVATGTADVAIMTMKFLKPERIIGIDISEGMLELGRKKIAKLKLNDRIELQSGDSETIKFPDNSFDAVTVAFGVRNFQDLRKGLSEMFRVLKPGGKLVVLEFSKPKAAGFKGLYQLYMNLVAPGIGKLFSRNKAAYQYLNDSVQAFPEGKDFINILAETGYSQTYLKKLSLGICTIYCGTKSAAKPDS